MISYRTTKKHNEANGEDNKDGESHNRSWNCGVEGETDDVAIKSLRLQQKKNLLATMFLSQGVPMLLAGDELGRTQKGNNNAYCQDNELSWINWSTVDRELLDFTRMLIDLRLRHEAFSRRRWFQGQPIKGLGVEDIAWFLPEGIEMTDEHWKNDFAKSLAIYLNGHGIHPRSARGEQILDDNFYIIFNAHYEAIDFTLPAAKYGKDWEIVFDTSKDQAGDELYEAGRVLPIAGRCVVLLKCPIRNEKKNQ